MPIPSNEIKFSDVNSEVTYPSGYKLPVSKHWVNVVERDGNNQVSMSNLQSKKVSYNIYVQSAYGNGQRTPFIKITDMFSYMTDDDWFSVDVAFTESGWIPVNVWRVFFKYNVGGNVTLANASDRYPDGYNSGAFQVSGSQCLYYFNASNYRKNQRLQIFYDASSKLIWASAYYFGDSTKYPSSRTILRKIQYWPPETRTTDQEVPAYDNNGYYTGIDARIIDFYRRILSREPDQSGALYWQDQLATQSLTIEQIEVFFYNSSEYNTGRIFNTNQVLRVRMNASFGSYNSSNPAPYDSIPTY